MKTIKYTRLADYEDLNDLDLVRRVSQGDENALRHLYETYADLLFAYIKHLLSRAPRVVIEDLWQDTLLSIIKGLENFRGDSRLFTWMCGIAKHKAVEIRRRQKSHINTDFNDPVYHYKNLLDENILPEEILLQKSTRCRVIEALGILPEKQQTALRMRYIEGLSVKELAKSIGKTYKATESLLSRARIAFKSAFIKLSGE